MNIRAKKKEELKEAALADLATFIQVVHPQRVLGSVHTDLISWWTRDGAKSHQLVLLPRDHGKSAMAAYRAAWEITKDPSIRILYISSTANLATKQLKFIKDILESNTYRSFWPEMVNAEESKREKWTESEICVDHPKRKEEIVRDPTVFTAGLTTNIVGLHCDIAILDDVVVDDNAYTQEGRNKTKSQASYLASILGAEGRLWSVGTRYHPRDLYDTMTNMKYELYNKSGEITGEIELYEVYEKQVEDSGDGTGQFIWPRQQRYDGKWFGFDMNILARKRAQYSSKSKFRAQYYNNPNVSGGGIVSRSQFQFFDIAHVFNRDGYWFYKQNKLNVFAAVDFAYSRATKADFTSIVVIGVDHNHNYYVLDIDRFKTDKISEYYQHIFDLHTKWDFRKIRAEVTAAQQVISRDLKDNYIRKYGLSLAVEEYRPTRHIGSKEERIEAILQPKYSNNQIWHYVGGNCNILEDELVSERPAHDDVKDCLASAVDFAVAPNKIHRFSNLEKKYNNMNVNRSRFGGAVH